MAKINYENVKAYLQGNFRLILSKFDSNTTGKFLRLPDTLKEQVAYRMDVCKDSCPTKCKHCGCSTPGKFFVDKSCGGGKYPDIMSEEEWEEFKKENNI